MPDAKPSNHVIQTVDHGDWLQGLIPLFVKRHIRLELGALVSGIAALTKFGREEITVPAVAAAAASGVVLAAAIRRYRIKGSLLGEACHNLLHDARDYIPLLSHDAQQGFRDNERHDQFWSRIADRAAQFAGALIQTKLQKRTGCVILRRETCRIFSVVARGGQITTDARLESICESTNRGIISRIKGKMQQRGVFIINDIDEAMREGDWESCGLETLECVKSLAVLPINAPMPADANGLSSKRLIGLLIITTDQAGAIQRIHAEFLKALADFFAMCFMLSAPDESENRTPGQDAANVVRLTSSMDFARLFSDLHAGQTLHWLDTFCPDWETWLSEVESAVARGAHIRMLLLDESSQSAKNRAKELERNYGGKKFLRELKRFNKAIRECKEHCVALGAGSLELMEYDDNLGSPSYIVCDESSEPIYGYSSEYLCNPTVRCPHFCWNRHHRDQLKSRLNYLIAKWDACSPQTELEFA